MAVKYTNRKGIEHHLYESITKSGKLRYVFARVPKGELVASLPEGYVIRENVNGVVSLAKAVPAVLSDIEVAVVEREIRRHPKATEYRVEAKGPRITVYENIGPDPAALAELMISPFGGPGPTKEVAQRARVLAQDLAQFSPVMRFVLTDKNARLFDAERMCYHSAVDGWLRVEFDSSLEQLAQQLVPLLGTDEFFELF